MKPAFSEQRNRAVSAMSADLPTRPAGCCSVFPEHLSDTSSNPLPSAGDDSNLSFKVRHHFSPLLLCWNKRIIPYPVTFFEVSG